MKRHIRRQCRNWGVQRSCPSLQQECWGIGVGLFVATLCLHGVAWADPAPVANWRFGKVQLTDLGTGQLSLYMSLHNHGDISRETVKLHLTPPHVSSPGRLPTLTLTSQTVGKRSTIVRATLALPATVKNHGRYRIFLQVDRTVTDMLPVDKGQPQSQSAERRRFQR